MTEILCMGRLNFTSVIAKYVVISKRILCNNNIFQLHPNIFNNISFATHNLLMTAEANGKQFTRFDSNLFGIDHTITHSNANYSVAFQSFTISWNLNRGYKTKVITSLPKKAQQLQMKTRKWLCQWKYVIQSIHVVLG